MNTYFNKDNLNDLETPDKEYSKSIYSSTNSQSMSNLFKL